MWLTWSFAFLAVAIIAGLLGFFGLEGAAAASAKLVAVACAVLFVASRLGRNRQLNRRPSRRAD